MEKIENGLRKFYHQPEKAGNESDRNGEAPGYYSMRISEMIAKGFETVPIYYPRLPIDKEKKDIVVRYRKSYIIQHGNLILNEVGVAKVNGDYYVENNQASFIAAKEIFEEHGVDTELKFCGVIEVAALKELMLSAREIRQVYYYM